jgi:DNA invertase Pin-like site-specific DNA recombinase
MLIGYARVSTQDQNLDLQREALTKAGCKKVLIPAPSIHSLAPGSFSA